MKRPKLLTLTIWLLLCCARVAQSSSEETGKPTFLGIRLGEMSLGEVLWELGPADCSALEKSASMKSTPGGILLRFRREVCLAECHPGTVLVFSESKEYIARHMLVTFSRDEITEDIISLEEVEGAFGKNHRVVRHTLKEQHEGLEGSLSQCDDPNGEYVSWVYPELGLQVHLAGAHGAIKGAWSLRFSVDIWSGKESYPPCE